MYEHENRTFQPEWEEEFAFTDNEGKPVCLIFHASRNHYKTSNLKRYHEAKHNLYHYFPYQSDVRRC